MKIYYSKMVNFSKNTLYRRLKYTVHKMHSTSHRLLPHILSRVYKVQSDLVSSISIRAAMDITLALAALAALLFTAHADPTCKQSNNSKYFHCNK